VQQDHRDGLWPPRPNAADHPTQLGRRQRDEDLSVEARPLADADPIGTLYERRRDARLERVEIGTRLAADLEHVLENPPSSRGTPRAPRRSRSALVATVLP
jgi:hypothetical protein